MTQLKLYIEPNFIASTLTNSIQFFLAELLNKEFDQSR